MTWLWTSVLLLSLGTLQVTESEPTRGPQKSPQPLPEGVTLSALITDTRLPEISGLAVSRRHPGIVWMHNDSYDANALFAVDTQGTIRATLQLPVPNIDWEDIASYEHEGKAFLLVADTGDNGGVRKDLVLHEVEEPGELHDSTAHSVRSIRFRWPDGARDCEALAVDVDDNSVWLVSKKRVPPELFYLPLFPTDPDALQVAQKRAELARIKQPTARDRERSPVFGKYRSQVTAADISSDGRYFAVMTYLQVYLWPRHRDGWDVALTQSPTRFDLPWMAQAEAMGFDASGNALWVSSEHLPAPLIRFEIPE